MNKKNEKKNLKKIISITKVKSINKLPSNEKRKINRIKNISNSNLECQEIDISTKKEKHEKRLEISEDEGKKIKNKNGEKDANNYFDFNAHFKYNELVEALNTLKNDKHESNSKNNKTTKEKESNNNYQIISRNVKMNNYVKYLELIEDKKNKEIFTNIPKFNKNKTTYFPQSESLKKIYFLNLKNWMKKKIKKRKFQYQNLNQSLNQRKKNIQIKLEKLQKKLILLRMIKNIII